MVFISLMRAGCRPTVIVCYPMVDENYKLLGPIYPDSGEPVTFTTDNANSELASERHARQAKQTARPKFRMNGVSQVILETQLHGSG